MIQHMGADSLSNRSTVVVQGRQSVEVRPVGVTKVSPLVAL
jgi:hypothetical protein